MRRSTYHRVDFNCRFRVTRNRIRPAGLEPATDGLENRCSILLSYGRETRGSSANGMYSGITTVAPGRAAPGRIRTCDLRFRKPPLYPPELRAQNTDALDFPTSSGFLSTCWSEAAEIPADGGLGFCHAESVVDDGEPASSSAGFEGRIINASSRLEQGTIDDIFPIA